MAELGVHHQKFRSMHHYCNALGEEFHDGLSHRWLLVLKHRHRRGLLG